MTSRNLYAGSEAPIVRPLRSNDVQDAKALIREVWREHFEHHTEAFVRDYLLLPNALDDIDEAAVEKDAKSLFLVLEVADGLVATGAIHGVSEDVCELSRMFVARAWRRRGLATKLMRCLLDFAREKNFKIIRLASNTQLTASHQFYRSFGFRHCQSWDTEDDHHSISMQLAL